MPRSNAPPPPLPPPSPVTERLFPSLTTGQGHGTRMRAQAPAQRDAGRRAHATDGSVRSDVVRGAFRCGGREVQVVDTRRHVRSPGRGGRPGLPLLLPCLRFTAFTVK